MTSLLAIKLNVKEPSMNTLEYALNRVAAGIPVFPLHANSKVPATENGFHDASTDINQVEGWFQESDYNLAIPTGKRSGIICIDIDIKHGLDGRKSLMNKFSEKFVLPEESMLAKTASGGWHVYVKYEPEIVVSCGTNILGLDGVDIRGEGGFIVSPPSKLIIDGEVAHYRVNDINAPITSHYGWITELLTEFKHYKKRTPFDPKPVMDGTSQGSRNSTLFAYSRHLFARGLDYELVMGFVLEAAHRCSPALPEYEARTVVNNAYRYNKKSSEQSQQTFAPKKPTAMSLKEVL